MHEWNPWLQLMNGMCECIDLAMLSTSYIFHQMYAYILHKANHISATE